MTTDELHALLRLWGRAYGERPPSEWDEDRTLTGRHALDRAQEFAPGRKVRRLDVAYRRKARKGEPAWAREHVTCTESRVSQSATLGGGSAMRFTPVVERVQTVALQLRKADEVRGLVLQAEYCKRGPQAEKAAWVTTLGHPMSVRTYRERLASAVGFVEAKLAA